MLKPIPIRLVALLLLFVFPAPVLAALPVETKEQKDARMKWFAEARFGMFIHWGVYSVPAGVYKNRTDLAEWYLEESKMPVSEYEKFAQQFNPVKFDAKRWVAIAKGAGMKYIVITSKHHDGFGMWPSDQTDWCIKSTPFKRDPLMELSEACKEAGIKFCLYHSIMDWHHPDWGTRRKWNDKATGKPDMDRYTAYLKAQLKEIITRYHPGILWFDGEWESPWTPERGDDLYAYCRGLQPDIIVNNRVGKARAGMEGMDKGKAAGDYGTPEQRIPPQGFGPGVYWESCMTMNGHWGYNKNDHNWKSPETIVHNLVDCASKGGNYLLNVGPTAEGLIPQPSVERLGVVGKWMAANGESIYCTSASTIGLPKWGRCTVKGDKMYLHVFNWPANGVLEIDGLRKPFKQAYLLADASQKSLEHHLANDAPVVSIDVPKTAPDSLDTVIVVELKQE